MRASVAALLPNARQVEGSRYGGIGSGLAIEAHKRYGRTRRHRAAGLARGSPVKCDGSHKISRRARSPEAFAGQTETRELEAADCQMIKEALPTNQVPTAWQ